MASAGVSTPTLRCFTSTTRIFTPFSKARSCSSDSAISSSVGFHFTWAPDQAALTAVLPELEAVLADFDARPHWGKVFTTAPARVRDSYPQWAEFAALAERFDPRGVLRNPMLRPYFD